MNFLRIFLTGATEAAEAAESTDQTGMMSGMLDMFDVLMLLMFVGIGIYGLYSAIRLRREQILFPNKFLYPGGCAPEECLDPGEFIDFIVPRCIVLGILLIVMGGLFALNTFVLKLDSFIVNLVWLIVPIAVLGWFGVFVQRKAAKLYW